MSIPCTHFMTYYALQLHCQHGVVFIACWSQIQLYLTIEQRREPNHHRDRMIEFAASLSSESLTVCVPQLRTKNDDNVVSVTPEAICPACGGNARTVSGYPPQEVLLSVADIR